MRLAIDVRLPIECRQRLVVVPAIVAIRDLYPRQSIATTNATRAALAQRTAAILDRRLRDRAEHEATHPLRGKHQGQDARDNMQTDKSCERPVARHQLKCT